MPSWRQSPLVVLDLEGTGAQDRDQEAILEIALIPLAGGHPDLAGAFATMINPGRPVPRKPWISPGLTTKALATAPPIEDIAAELATRLAGATIVGHNVNVDWRLLNRRCPAIGPSALIDTLRLARHVQPQAKGNSLTTLLDRYQLTSAITALVPGSQPHRALWDATGTALLLAALISDLPGGEPTLAQLRRIAEPPASRENPSASQQATLLDI
jgi:DNA polymerase III subunit epsilon